MSVDSWFGETNVESSFTAINKIQKDQSGRNSEQPKRIITLKLPKSALKTLESPPSTTYITPNSSRPRLSEPDIIMPPLLLDAPENPTLDQKSLDTLNGLVISDVLKASLKRTGQTETLDTPRKWITHLEDKRDQYVKNYLKTGMDKTNEALSAAIFERLRGPDNGYRNRNQSIRRDVLMISWDDIETAAKEVKPMAATRRLSTEIPVDTAQTPPEPVGKATPTRSSNRERTSGFRFEPGDESIARQLASKLTGRLELRDQPPALSLLPQRVVTPKTLGKRKKVRSNSFRQKNPRAVRRVTIAHTGDSDTDDAVVPRKRRATSLEAPEVRKRGPGAAKKNALNIIPADQSLSAKDYHKRIESEIAQLTPARNNERVEKLLTEITDLKSEIAGLKDATERNTEKIDKMETDMAEIKQTGKVMMDAMLKLLEFCKGQSM